MVKTTPISPYKLPNLYIPGAGKSGTSTLHELLNQHPEICMSSKKEPHFWTNPEFENYSEDNYNFYLSLFDDPNTAYLGESSTGYLCFPEFIPRVKNHYKNSPKFIIILRNPIDRIYSHYWWLRGVGSENKSLKAAVMADFDIEPEESHRLLEGNFKSYFQFGLYGKWITKFIDEFGMQKIHIITTESLKNSKLQTVNSCFRFLDLQPLETLPEINSNKTKILRFPRLYKTTKKLVFNQNIWRNSIKIFIPIRYRQFLRHKLHDTVLEMTATNKIYPKITQDERVWLKDLYFEDVQVLKKITGLKFEEWQDFNEFKNAF